MAILTLPSPGLANSTPALAPAAPALGELSEGRKIFAFAVMCVGFFIALLDIQIVAASLKDIGGGLSAGADELSWIQTSYLIAEIIVIPLSGWLSRVMSTRWLFALSSLAPTLGPTVGGWITDNYSWHWLFFINLVPGIFVAVMVPMLVRIDKPNLALIRGADYLGMVLMAAFLGCLEYTLEEG